MAKVIGQVTAYDVKGTPRDLMHIITEISPTDTPFLTMCKESDATQTLHEWTTDELAAPNDNAHVDGADTTDFVGSSVTEMSNKTQILKKAVQVSGTAQSVAQEGVKDQYRYQLAQRLKEIKKDLERALLSNKTEAPGNKTTARVMRGLPAFLNKNVGLGAGGAAPNAASAAVAGASRALTEEMIREVVRKCYEAGGNVDLIMAAPKVRSQISGLLRGATNRTDNIKDSEVRATVEVYISDYGNIKIVPNRVQATVPYAQNAVFLLDPEYWAVAYLRKFCEEELAKTGDSRKGHIVCEATLEARQPDSSGMIADVG